MIFDKVKELLADQLCVDAEKITMDTAFVSDLGADSLDLVQLLIAMEKEYGIAFNDDEIQLVKTVGDVVNYIEKNKK